MNTSPSRVRFVLAFVVLGSAIVPSADGWQSGPAAGPSDALGALPGSGQTLTRDQLDFLSHVTIVYLDDGQGGTVKTARITGINVQLVNGLEATNGNPANPEATSLPLTSVNGLGNLIVGYNELGNALGDDRRGSHNLVVGHGNTYARFGGIVVGRDNVTAGAFASVSGGTRNTASADHASVGGGTQNIASRLHASVSGGRQNRASGAYSAVLGGTYNTASETGSCVSGGAYNTASGPSASVSGGSGNSASATGSSACGGYGNTATGLWSSVSGGYENLPVGAFSTVSGGAYRSVAGEDNWGAGELFQED